MASDLLYGWDLTFKTVENDIRRKSDVLITFIHWNLTKRGFRTIIGVGDETKITGEEEKSELLPNGWNDNDNYKLRYILADKLYILHGINSGGDLVINLMRPDDLSVSNIAFKIDESVKELKGPINVMLPNHKELIHNVKRDLIDTIIERPTSTAETQTSAENNRRSLEDPLWVPLPTNPHPNPSIPNLRELPPRNWPGAGRSDLDPFAPAGQGMLFDPFQRRDPENPGLGIPGGLPSGAVPPGARFDPFGPPAGPMPFRRPPPPDADHLPPPGGFHDNMFL